MRVVCVSCENWDYSICGVGGGGRVFAYIGCFDKYMLYEKIYIKLYAICHHSLFSSLFLCLCICVWVGGCVVAVLLYNVSTNKGMSLLYADICTWGVCVCVFVCGGRGYTTELINMKLSSRKISVLRCMFSKEHEINIISMLFLIDSVCVYSIEWLCCVSFEQVFKIA